MKITSIYFLLLIDTVQMVDDYDSKTGFWESL